MILKWVSKGYKPFGRVQRQRLWWGAGQSPTSNKTSTASAAKLCGHRTIAPLGLPDNVLLPQLTIEFSACPFAKILRHKILKYAHIPAIFFLVF